ncbi:hypothetical protein D1151_08440 [Emergencia sp. 1XD21-10]|nr:hypothetical protein [Emergencia sp. 1XD21-10]
MERIRYIDNLRSSLILFLIPYHGAMACNCWGEGNYVLAYVFAVILSSHRVCQCTGNGEVCRTDFALCEKVCRNSIGSLNCEIVKPLGQRQ